MSKNSCFPTNNQLRMVCSKLYVYVQVCTLRSPLYISYVAQKWYHNKTPDVDSMTPLILKQWLLSSVGYLELVNTWHSACTITHVDISYAHRTLVYEMVTMERPFHGVHGNSLIWQVSTGRTQSLTRLQRGKFREVIAHCWRADRLRRPSFQQLLGTIEQNVSCSCRKISILSLTIKPCCFFLHKEWVAE